ncbi:MAG: sulfurtransferase [Polaromonas sp.]|nr:sulfurtransferase [Polaromonas sp.]
MMQLQVGQVADWAKQMGTQHPGHTPLVLDVREPWELQTAAIANDPATNGFQVLHMPMRTVPARYLELDKHQPVACLCHHGARSMQVAMFLENNGFTQVVNIQGGIHAWATEVDARVPLY